MKRTGFSIVPLQFGYLFHLLFCLAMAGVTHAQSQTGSGEDSSASRKFFLDVHHFKPGSVAPPDVAKAHLKDLAVQSRYNVQFLQYWVNKDQGLVYCLSAASDSSSIRMTHGAAHGLLPGEIYAVTQGIPAAEGAAEGDYFLDIHTIKGVSAEAVEKAHQEDLKAQSKHHVHFLNYWVNEDAGLVFCLSKAKDADAVMATHRDAHGLLPDKILKVVIGQ